MHVAMENRETPDNQYADPLRRTDGRDDQHARHEHREQDSTFNERHRDATQGQRRAPVRFELIAVNVDQGWPGYDTPAIRTHLEREGVEHRMEVADYARIVEDKLRPGQTPCTLCSRFRRGYLYDLADKNLYTAKHSGRNRVVWNDLAGLLPIQLAKAG